MFKKRIGIYIATCALIVLTTQIGLTDVVISIEGKVKSHTDGTYTIETSKFLYKIKDKNLSLELKRILHRRIGRQVQITVPHDAISSQKPLKPKRIPANNSDTSTSDSKNNKTNK